MKKIILLLILAFAIERVDAQEYINYSESVNRFALDMYMEMVKGTDENIIFSPLSLSITMALVYTGSEGKTSDEIKKVLHFDENNDDFLNKYSEFINNLNESQSEEKFQLSIANALCVREKFKLNNKYKTNLRTYFNSDIFQFHEYNDAVNLVNEWVSKKTNNKIEKLLKPEKGNKHSQLILTNAIYFKDDWAEAFKKDQTLKDTFYLADGKKITTDFMRKEGYYQYRYFSNSAIIKLPYKNGKHEMIFVLPFKIHGIYSLEKEIKEAGIEKLFGDRSLIKYDLYLPKFTANYKNEKFVKEFQDLGILKAFGDSAEFYPMCEGNDCDLKISKIGHKAFIEVNEEGSEASAATFSRLDYFTGYSDNKKLKFDHPFLYFIIEKNTNTIIFMGRCMNPAI